MERKTTCSSGAISSLFHNCYLLDYHVKIGTRFLLQDKRLFKLKLVEKTRVDYGIIFSLTLKKEGVTSESLVNRAQNFTKLHIIIIIININSQSFLKGSA